MHLYTLTVSQIAWMPSINSCFVVGLLSLWINSFSSYHSFSMGLQLGDSAGMHHVPCDTIVEKECLSYMCPRSVLRVVHYESMAIQINCFQGGNSVHSKMEMYRGASIIPLKIQIPVFPCLLMPTHTFLFIGCLDRKQRKQNVHVNVHLFTRV